MLLDVKMPGTDGLTICKQIKSNKELAGIKVIMLTGNDTDEDRKKAEKAGANGYLNKTLTPNEIIRVINEIIGPA